MTEQEQHAGPSRETQELHEHENEQVLEFLREYGIPIVIGVVAALVIYLGYMVYSNYRVSLAERAAQGLMVARTPQELEEVVNKYSSTPAAPVAMLSLASTYLHGGQYQLSREIYTRFQNEYPKHDMYATAEMGLAYCAESEGNLEDALQRFTTFVDNHPEHFLMQLALFSRARCMEQLGRYSDAKAVYEDFIAAHPESRWVPQAETALLYVDKDLRLSNAQ